MYILAIGTPLDIWKKANISPSKQAYAIAHTMSQLHCHSLLFLFVKQKVKPLSGEHRDFPLPVVGGPPGHQLHTNLETLTSLPPYFGNTPCRCKIKHKKDFEDLIAMSILQRVHSEGSSQLGQTNEIPLASENTPLPSCL